MINELLTEENKTIVRSFYEGGTNSNKKEYGSIFHPGFMVTAPTIFHGEEPATLPIILDTVKISEHWEFRDGKAISLWVYF